MFFVLYMSQFPLCTVISGNARYSLIGILWQSIKSFQNGTLQPSVNCNLVKLQRIAVFACAASESFSLMAALGDNADYFIARQIIGQAVEIAANVLGPIEGQEAADIHIHPAPPRYGILYYG